MRKYCKWIGQRRAHTRHVLVIAGAFENVRLAVQQESLVLVKPHGADAEFGFLAVNNLAAALDRCDELVELG